MVYGLNSNYLNMYMPDYAGYNQNPQNAYAQSFTGASANISAQEIEKLAKYATGGTINQTDEKLTFGSVFAFPLAMEGGKWFARLVGIGQDKDPLTGKKQYGLKNLKRHYAKLQADTAQFSKLTKDKTIFQEAWKLQTQKETAELIAKHNKKVANPNWFRKLFNINGKQITKLSTVGRICKGNIGSAAIFGAIEALTVVVPTFKELGAGKGIKQLFKSTAKVGADVASWAIGMKAGAAIGSCFGAVGSIAGAILGTAAGMVLSHFTRKAVAEVVGKDERVKAQEEQTRTSIVQAQKDPEALNALIAKSVERIQAEGETPEAVEIAKTIEKIVANQTTAQTQQTPAFGNLTNRIPQFDMNGDFMAQVYGIC